MALQETMEKLIRFRTVDGENEEIRKLFAWVLEELAGLPLYFEHFEYNGVPSMVISTREGARDPEVLLMAHVDVVEGSAKMFEPWIEKDYMYGRGAFDMKNAVALFIELMKDLGDELAELDVSVMLTGDEETGGFNGTGKLVELDKFKPKVALLPECGGPAWHFEERAKGLVRFRVISTGITAHSSRTWEGKSATKALVDFLGELDQFFYGLRIGEENRWYPTLNIAQLESNFAYNQVPDLAMAKIEFRFTDQENHNFLKEKIDELLSAHGLEMKVDALCSAHEIDRGDPALQKFADIAKEFYGIECGFTKSHGSSDARWFAPCHVPVIIIWPHGAGQHGENEYIDLKDLQRYYDVMKEWVRREAKKSEEVLSLQSATV